MCPAPSGMPLWGALAPLGDRTACPTAAGPLEREAGARVATNVFLRDLNLGMPLSDVRRLEVVANGLPGFGSVQVAVDATLVSPVRRDGTNDPMPTPSPASPCGRQRTTSAGAPTRSSGARAVPPRCRRPRGWGRWGDETEAFLHRLARGKALTSPEAHAAYARRWAAQASSARFLPTLATPLPVRRRRATSATPAGRRTREGPCASPRLDGKRRVREKMQGTHPLFYPLRIQGHCAQILVCKTHRMFCRLARYILTRGEPHLACSDVSSAPRSIAQIPNMMRTSYVYSHNNLHKGTTRKS